jgi:2-methylisocitrate lyase-like PEP mutase family enzyme
MNASIRSSVGDAQKSAKNTAQTRSVKLRQMLHSAELEFLMEAHNGLSARIVREAGFKGIWASGLMISAQFGVRDFAYCSRGDGRGLFGTPVLLERVTSAADAVTSQRACSEFRPWAM